MPFNNILSPLFQGILSYRFHKITKSMEKILVSGGNKLSGEIKISGAKNSALPLLTVSILTKETIELHNVPELADIKTMLELLSSLGVIIKKEHNLKSQIFSNSVISLSGKDINNLTAIYDIVRKMRASVIVLGPMLARFGEAKVSLPGGCAIGTRPVDIHLEALEKMGAEIQIDGGYIIAKTKKGHLTGAEINFRFPSVGATENILMAASLAKGKTTITNAAKEPEIVDLANLLNKMGAKIKGAGTATIIIDGVKHLNGAVHNVIADRIEAGTFAILAQITNSDLTLKDLEPSHLVAVFESLEKTGAKVEIKKNTVSIKASKTIKPVSIKTEIFPGFPTDMQAQWVALMCLAKGVSEITENIFENRFMHIAELRRMGAKIEEKGELVHITGVEHLKPAQVMATDLRASVSLILAGLATKGETIIDRVYHLDRGYEKIEEKLSLVGAKIKRIV